MRGHVVFLNRFAPPDISATSQILGSLVASLASDFEVEIIASQQCYDDHSARLPAKEIVGGVAIHRVATSHFGRKKVAGRIIDYLTYYFSAVYTAWRIARKGSVIVCMTDPPLLSVPIAIVAQLRRAVLVNWLQDVFPEVAVKLNMRLGGKVVIWLLQSLRNRSLKVAHVNVVLGQKMAELVQTAEPDCTTTVIPNWSPTERIAPLERSRNALAQNWQISQQFVVGYSGNLGKAHDLQVLIDAAAILKARDEILFLIIGDGGQRDALLADVRQRGLNNVVFKPYQPLSMLEYSLTLPDLHVVSLKPELEGLVVPSKFYSSVAAGKPIVFIGSSAGELARWVDGSRACGIVVSPNEPEELASAISYLCDNLDHRSKMASNSRSLYLEQFATPVALDKWKSTMRKLFSE